ncbi:hypothetical protein GLX30_24775 [Streptomyces sp. Tu 2975]|uniref:DUF6338 family protein n=1 Tax=Streptomyces sp. Tu 2975 TaxID=2676871 RepID=UPI001357CCCE|nr:DUF6338 family protein [Streptomyces sp. Tu 2975]QIP86699.1 hypothetical protein GLX30_24775 [Streptomyces sp. Tu 2975]
MPSSLIGLVALIFVAVPGYFYLVRYERRGLRERHGSVREIAELFAVGAFVAVAVGGSLFMLAEVVPGLATLEGIVSGYKYLQSHPWHLARSACLLFIFSAMTCAVLGDIRGRKRSDSNLSNHPGTVWTDLLQTPRGESDPIVEVLMDDGTRVHGRCHMVSLERDIAQRDVALHHPVAVQAPGQDLATASPADYVIIPGGLIRLIQITTLRDVDSA